MQSIVMFGATFVAWIRGLVGIVLPIFAEAADFRTWPKWFRLLVHAIILGVIFYGLWYLNKQQFVQDLLKSRATNAVKEIYLPLIFLLIYVITWLGYFWWKLFNRGDAAEFPDIEAAWDDAIRKLAQSGYKLGDAPLYLVLGKPNSGDDALFLASGQRIEVRAPLSVDSPLRIFAGPDAIFVCCSGASTWGSFADALANPELGAFDTGGAAVGAGATITPGQALQGVDEKIQDEFYRLLQLQSDRPLTPEEDARLRELGEMIQSTKSGGGIRRVNLSNEVLGLGPRRLAFLCKLIARDRRPWCPLNGMMVLLPWAALETDEICRNALGVLANDLATARAAFRQRFAHFLMVCDLEQAPGFEEFRRGFPKEMLKQRIGQRLPVVPDRPPEEVPSVMEQAADWIRMNVLASWIVKYLRLDWPPDARSGAFVPPYNQKLFTFLHEMFLRGPRLGRVMARGLPVESSAVAGDGLAALPLVAGCYLAATGRDEKHQAFVAGVFQRLTESQSAVSWSADSLVEDKSYSQWAFLLYLAAALLVAIVGGIVYLQFFKDLKA